MASSLILCCSIGQQCRNSLLSSQVHCNSLQQNKTRVTYTCNTVGSGDISWSLTSSFFSKLWFGSTAADGGIHNNFSVNGVDINETHTRNNSCITSTLSFFGSNLYVLDGSSLRCRTSTNIREFEAKISGRNYYNVNLHTVL